MQENLGRFNEFLEAPLNSEERSFLVRDKEALLQTDKFSSILSFGTGGVRAIVELGTNRLNRFNIAKLTFAVLSFTKKRHPSQPKPKIILGYDSRLSSESFAFLIYHICKKNDFGIKVFKQPTPTPLISFAVREFKAQAGIILTASHNPSEYNGFKLMMESGAQLISPQDKEVEQEFLNYPYSQIPAEINEWQEKPAQEDMIEEEVIEAYLSKLKTEAFLSHSAKRVRILYSPLHGTGGWAFEKAFPEFGYENFSILETQKKPDGNFPTVKSPNPEEPSAFELLIQEGQKQKSELLLATDPDADRIGCAVLENGDYTFLSGNQIGSLMLDYIAKNLSPEIKNPYICKTIVTTELQRRIAEKYNITTKETLTGFKYIASVIEKDPENYVFGGEESFGYLPIHWIRDKDSVSSGLLLAEIASQTNLVAALNQIYMEHGLYEEKLLNIKLNDDSLAIIEKIKSEFLDASLFMGKTLGNRKIVEFLNLNHQSNPQDDFLPVTENGKRLYADLPAANVLQVWLEPEGRLTIRPSGTEPKVKVYISLRSVKSVSKEDIANQRKELQEEAEAVGTAFLKKIGIH